MTPEERRTLIHSLAAQFLAIHGALEELLPQLPLEIDRKAVKSIMKDLAWAKENCTVVAKHQVGEALNDAMGISPDGTVR